MIRIISILCRPRTVFVTIPNPTEPHPFQLLQHMAVVRFEGGHLFLQFIGGLKSPVPSEAPMTVLPAPLKLTFCRHL